MRLGIRHIWAALVASFLSLPQSISAAEDTVDAVFSRDPADKPACEANLNFIFGAIREYRKQHQDKLPDKLSDLNPQYIHDPKMLICPYVQRTGGLRQWRKQIRELDFDPRTSYGYEFPQKEMPDNLWRGLPKKTWRDYKERQMEELGKLSSVVPVVRCHFHRPRLNLAFDGHIYESELDWELKYTNFVSVENLFPARLFSDPAGRKKVVAADFQPRDPRAFPRFLDLSEHYNGLLTDSWQGFPGNHLAQLPSGLREFGSVPFDVRGVIQLRGMQVPFPERIEGIRVNQKLSRIHFLHAAAFGLKSPTNIATYVIHYADNQVREIPIVYGRQMADWWVDPQHPDEPAEAKVVWTGQNEASTAYAKSLRLYQFSWKNPLSEIQVAGISLISRATVAAPFVIAITIDP